MAVEKRAVVLKASMIAALPAALLGIGALLYDRTPDTAADLEYQVVKNRLTGQACLEFPAGDAPEGLHDLTC